MREHEDGTRVYSWTPPEITDLAGIVLRYSASAAMPWADMTPLHAGVLTDSPYEALEPGAGTWTVAARALSTGGVESESASVRVTLGAASASPASAGISSPARRRRHLARTATSRSAPTAP